jgi:K+-sensing histidine kinase KdpD
MIMLLRTITFLTLRRINTVIGVSLCATLATFAAILFSANPHKNWLPILFIAVLLVAALRFGAVSGLFGGVAAALIFAYFLFAPVGSLRIERQDARDNLGWMLLVGIPASYFVAHTRRSGKPGD